MKEAGAEIVGVGSATVRDDYSTNEELLQRPGRLFAERAN